jgi:lia operon protein LiaG
MKRLLLVVAAVLFAAAVGYAEGEPEFAAQNRELDGKVFHSAKAVLVEGAFCDVSAAGGSEQGVKVGVTIEDEYTAVYYEMKGDTLHVWVERDWDLFSGWPVGVNSLEFSLPAGTTYTVKNSSGKVELHSHQADAIRLAASSGSILARECAGALTLSSSSGEIKLMKAEGDVTSHTTSGAQQLEQVRGAVTCRSSSGSLELSDIEGDVDAQTTSGAVTVTRIKGRAVRIHSTSGRQRLESVSGALDLTCSSGEIAGEKITLSGDSSFHTTSGEINLELMNREDCSFTLRSASGSLAVAEERARKKLIIPEGSIMVKATSASGSIRFE